MEPKPRRQYAALPLGERDGRVCVMLITSRQTRRWVIPKGNPERGVDPHTLAAKEAYEEAGLVGRVGHEPVGTYHYAKRLRDGRTVPCEVVVFPFAVETQAEEWPEKGQRKTRWFTPPEAALRVDESGLVAILLALAADRLGQPSCHD